MERHSSGPGKQRQRRKKSGHSPAAPNLPGFLPRSSDTAPEHDFCDFRSGASPAGESLSQVTHVVQVDSGEAQPHGAAEAAEPHYHGHRDRLKQKLLDSNGAALADYELLEALLFNAIPRRDTKPIAKALLQRFGSFAEVLNAPESELRKFAYVKDGAVREFALVRAAAQRLLRSEVVGRPVLSSWARVLDHCRAAMAYEPREQFRILFLDKRNRLILDEVQQQGTVDHTPVYVREVCRRALELSATALILAHNHPSGDPTPSRGDIEMTREIVRVAQGLGITVHDHVIIARDGHASLKGLGLI